MNLGLISAGGGPDLGYGCWLDDCWVCRYCLAAATSRHSRLLLLKSFLFVANQGEACGFILLLSFFFLRLAIFLYSLGGVCVLRSRLCLTTVFWSETSFQFSGLFSLLSYLYFGPVGFFVRHLVMWSIFLDDIRCFLCLMLCSQCCHISSFYFSTPLHF